MSPYEPHVPHYVPEVNTIARTTITTNGHAPDYVLPLTTITEILSSLHERIVELEQQQAEMQRRLDALGQKPVCPYVMRFTKRENAVLQAIWDGDTTAKMIAHRLRMNERTAQSHLSNMFRKAGVESKVDLMLWAMGNWGTK